MVHSPQVVLLNMATGKSSKKKLPRSTTMGAVKLLCERLFKIKAGRQVLVVGGGDGGGGGGGPGGLEIGGDDTKPLSFWELEVRGRLGALSAGGPCGLCKGGHGGVMRIILYVCMCGRWEAPAGRVCFLLIRHRAYA